MSAAEVVFFAALAKVDPAERAAYLHEACGTDADLRRQVERLLAAHPQVGSFLRDDAVAEPSPRGGVVRGDATVEAPVAERAGTVIGPYKLLQQIGEGGMGVVWMAEQTEPVQRQVALKVIKPGMDSRQVIARFEAERQALALMDHVNIARVFDGGTTENGRPYFVMELVHGLPITQYCDANRLTPRARLELFAPVCQAIQHAHQKGIIHRDVKPSNVMVTLYDGKPVPKVIDFGVAKATEQKLTERTLFTHDGTMIGTLEYMSPEQAETSASGVDTRSDIYSLGVLLYELLTGSTPLTRKRMKEAAYAEILRMIKEEEPPRPSTRLSDSGEALASISANRHTEPAKLTKLVRGELDWIVMKALEKDRNRRYETAGNFAADVQRYLNDEPVLACPPSAGYRLHKFARRRKGVLTASLLIALALVVGTVLSAWQARNANTRRLEAETARQEAIDNLEQAREAVDQMLTRVSEEKLFNTPQTELLRKALLEDALKFYQRFLRQAGTDPAVRLGTGEAYRRTGQIYRQLGHPDQAEPAYREAIDLLEKLVSDAPTKPASRLALALSYHGLGGALVRMGRFREAEPALRRATGLMRGLTADFPMHDGYAQTLATMNEDLAGASEHLLRVTEERKTEQSYRENLQWQEKLHAAAPNDPNRRHAVADAQMKFGRSLQGDRPQEAERLFRDAIAGNLKLTGEFPRTTQYRADLADAYHHLFLLLRESRRFEEAEAVYRQALPHLEKVIAEAPTLPDARRLLIELYWDYALMQEDAGRPQEADKALRQAITAVETMCAAFPTYAWAPARLACIHNHIGQGHQTNGRVSEAEAAYRTALTVAEKAVRAGLPQKELRCRLADSCLNLGLLLMMSERHKEGTGVLRKPLEPELSSADACNYVAWQLATDTTLKLRPPEIAVEFARKAVELAPEDGNFWSTLGVAHVRAGKWQESLSALQKSKELRKGGNSVDGFFLAMAHWHLGDKDEARKWYSQGVQWLEKHEPRNDELRRFRAEAAELLGIKKMKD
jgi:serine/threonine protein kinase/tetratricopeptide (TPR) repeat protein